MRGEITGQPCTGSLVSRTPARPRGQFSRRAKLHPYASRSGMGCGICLEAYTADERPAALPCGHIFHANCVHDWLNSRSHGALPAGCPLCKATASPSSILPLWPGDADDFHQYVAVHSQSNDESHQLLMSVRDLVFAIQSYAMAAHGLRSAAMARAASTVQVALQRGAIRDAHAASSLQDALAALHRACLL